MNKKSSKTYRVPQEHKDEQRATHFRMGYEAKHDAAALLASSRTQSAIITGAGAPRPGGLYDQWKSTNQNKRNDHGMNSYANPQSTTA